MLFSGRGGGIRDFRFTSLKDLSAEDLILDGQINSWHCSIYSGPFKGRVDQRCMLPDRVLERS